MSDLDPKDAETALRVSSLSSKQLKNIAADDHSSGISAKSSTSWLAVGSKFPLDSSSSV